MKREQFYKQLKSLRVPFRFTLRANHLFLFSTWQREPFKMARLAFQFGFLQGQRAMEDENLKKAKSETERHAPGYGYLLATIERHMSNAEFVRGMLVRAHSLDRANVACEEGAVGHAEKT